MTAPLAGTCYPDRDSYVSRPDRRRQADAVLDSDRPPVDDPPARSGPWSVSGA